MWGGEEVLEAEFALSPISTFGLQMLSPLSSIIRLVWWLLCVLVFVPVCVGVMKQGRADATLP